MTKTYIVRSGDSMSSIAASHGIALNQLLELNPHIDNPDLIFAGEAINVPSDSNGSSPGTPAAGPEPAWFAIAKGELGTTEYPSAQHNPRILEYHATTSLNATSDETPWCSSFVNWCVRKAGKSGTNSAAARSWMKWGKNLSEPREGCIVVFSRPPSPWSGHVGFFERRAGSHIVVLGGNQSNSVNLASYSDRRLLGYRWLD